MEKKYILLLSILTFCFFGIMKYNFYIKTSNNLRQLSSIDFTKGLLMHNQYRKAHHVPNLKINKDLTTVAQKYANYLAEKDKFEHSKTNFKGKPKGENLYLVYSNAEIPCDGNKIVEATKSWYNEITKYDFNKPGFSMETGHFTQVVWKNSKEVGFGVAKTKNKKKCIVVANYFPAGNYLNQFKENVLRK